MHEDSRNLRRARMDVWCSDTATEIRKTSQILYQRADSDEDGKQT